MLFADFPNSKFWFPEFVSSYAWHVTRVYVMWKLMLFQVLTLINWITRLEKGHLVLDKPIAVFHVSMNNTETMESGSILSAFNNLITSISQLGATLIVISSILPRPKDHAPYGD